MMRSILLPLDGSSSSLAAQTVAFKMARDLKVSVCGLGILDTPTIRHPEPTPIGGEAFKTAREEALTRKAVEQIDRFLSLFESSGQSEGLSYEILSLEGRPCVQIAAESQKHDLICIGRKTHFHFATQDEPDDTVRLLAHRTPRPILSVPDVDVSGRGVLVAYDDTLPSARALQMFQLMGLYRDEDVLVVSVAESLDEAEEMSSPALSFLKRHQRRVTARPVVSEMHPAKALLQELPEVNPAVLVMGCYGARGLTERLFGSTTDRLLFDLDLPVPVFVYH